MPSLPNHPYGTSHLPQPPSDNGTGAVSVCDQLRELIPAYSIGATDPQETAFVEANLLQCPAMALELSEYLVLADQFLYVPAIDDRPLPVYAPLPLLTVPPPAPRVSPATQPSARPLRWSLAAILALVLFGGVNVYWSQQVQQLQDERALLTLQLNASRTALVSADSTQVHHRDLLPNEQTQVSDEAHATLIWNSSDEVGSLYVSGLPTLPADKTYQLWVVRDGHSLSLGTFHPDMSGVGTLVFQAAEPITDFQHVGISEEPENGSPVPTTPHLVLGSI